MSTLTNVFAAHANGTGTIYAGATNLGGYQIKPGGTAGTIELRDGGASGTLLLELDITVNTAVIATLLPGNGIRFTSSIHATLPASAAITIFCG
jgi:hypothetical protein